MKYVVKYILFLMHYGGRTTMSTRNTLLLADDMGSNREFLHKLFEDSFQILEAENGEQALSLIAEHRETIAAVLLDIIMPIKDGYQVLAEMNEKGYLEDIPVIVVTSDSNQKSEARALELGALDLIAKPYDPYVIRRRVKNMVELKQHRRMLTQKVGEMTEAMSITNDSIVNTLATITEFRSLESGQHILRIRNFTKILLEEVASSFPEYELDEKTISTISSASVLHDIGKISIPDSVLNKPGKLTKEEFENMKTHTTAGCDILDGMTNVVDREYMRYAYNICRYHHERWDGGGYPDGLKGNNIPICAQVVSIADVYDALTTKRVYKGAIGHDESANMILNGECGVFNPNILECFKRVLDKFSACASSYADGTDVDASDIHIPLPLPKTVSGGLHTQQMSTIKYHTLLNYTGGIVIEVDLDNGSYHLVFNEGGLFSTSHTDDNFESMMLRTIENAIHKEDKTHALQCYTYFKSNFFEEGLRKFTQRFRMRFEDKTPYASVECTFLRVDTGNPNQRKALMICKKVSKSPMKLPAGVFMEKWGSVTLRDMMGSVIRCKNDRLQSILDGADHLAEFLGYTVKEFKQAYGNRLVDAILPEDRETVLSHAYKQMSYGTNVEIEYRLLGKGGHVTWVRDRACILHSGDGIEYTYHALTDITPEKKALDLLRSVKERHQIMLTQIDEVVFEWDVAADVISFSPNFKKQFGYEPVSSRFSETILAGTNKIHPDDFEILKSQIWSIRSKQDYPSFLGADFRIRKADGSYTWRRMRANTQQMENGKIECVIGSLVDIDKHIAETVTDKSELDSLTKLYNLQAAQDRIDAYLKDRHIGERSALILMDLDHFNEVNTRYGRMAGDSMLLQCADLLNTLFYNGDILARIGGDAFMVFAKNTPSQTLLESQCRHIIDEISQEAAKNMPDCRVSCSMGTAIIPEDGENFDELFLRAEQALYNAKLSAASAGSGGAHAFYQQGDDTAIGRSFTSHIESDDIPGLADESLMHHAFNRLYQSGNVNETIQSILETIGKQMNVSRVYIFENNDDNTCCSNTFEWCNRGIAPEIDNLQNISYEHDVPGWKDHYNAQGIFLCEDIKSLSDSDRAILEPQGIRSMLHCAIMDNGEFRGFVGIDECLVDRAWTREQVDILSMVSRLTAVFLMKKRIQDKKDQWEESLITVLEDIPFWVYIIDPETCEVFYSNSNIRNVIPDMQPGAFCHKAMMKADQRCADCPALELEGTEKKRIETSNDQLGLKLQAEASLMKWKGRDAAMIVCSVRP